MRWCSVTTDGSHNTPLDVLGWDVLWSPTSGQVAYLRDPPRRAGGGNKLQVWTSAPSGARARLLVTQAKECCITLFPYLAWAGDGRQLIATGAEAQIINQVTGQASQLDWWSPSLSNPAWRRP
jgi:hypothetical protein